MLSKTILDSPRLKVQRANQHVDELIRLSSPLDRTLYTLEVKTYLAATHNKPGGCTLAYSPLQPIPKLFALIIGDVVHNLRGALDHLATGIVRSVDPSAEIHFPMYKLRKDLISSKYLGTIEQALPGARVLLLNEIRPENGPNENRWLFSKLDNDDKHNLLIPTVVATEFSNINTVINGSIIQNFQSGVNAAYPIDLIYSDTPFTINDNFKTSVQILFPQGGLFENEPVVPTLLQISKVVSETIEAFGRLIV